MWELQSNDPQRPGARAVGRIATTLGEAIRPPQPQQRKGKRARAMPTPICKRRQAPAERMIILPKPKSKCEHFLPGETNGLLPRVATAPLWHAPACEAGFDTENSAKGVAGIAIAPCRYVTRVIANRHPASSPALCCRVFQPGLELHREAGSHRSRRRDDDPVGDGVALALDAARRLHRSEFVGRSLATLPGFRIGGTRRRRTAPRPCGSSSCARFLGVLRRLCP